MADIMEYFEQLAAIPHGSYHTRQISDFLVGFAKERGLKVIQDEAGNVIIFKKASETRKDREPIILQGHMDMVLEKNADRTIDLEKEAITLIREGDWLRADGTTLGADDGVAVAMMMALLDDDTLEHPPLECVITVDEEVGMLGAEALDTAPLKGKRLLNLDSEDEGVFTAGCAGGAEENFCVPFKFEKADKEDGRLVTLYVDGLLGGHSGDAINRGRANADLIMARLLYQMSRKISLRLVSIKGGNKDNAIPRESRAQILIPAAADRSFVEGIVQKLDDQIVAEYRLTDPGLSITWDWYDTSVDPDQTGTEESHKRISCMTEKSTKRALRFLLALPNGVMEYSPVFEGLPQTSLNLGILRTDHKEHALKGTFLVRSSINSQKHYLVDRLRAIVREFDGELEECGVYPAWEYRKDSPLRDLIVSVYEKKTNEKAKILMIHGGLECGLLSGKIRGLDCVSLGPQTEDIHTPSERLNIPSFYRTYELVRSVLERA